MVSLLNLKIRKWHDIGVPLVINVQKGYGEF
jgi:hypothetical protein